MRKLAFAFVAAFALAAPTVASAQGFGFYIGDDGNAPRYYRDYDRGYVEHRPHDWGWHRGWDRHHYRHGERVIIKRHHHDWDDDD